MRAIGIHIGDTNTRVCALDASTHRELSRLTFNTWTATGDHGWRTQGFVTAVLSRAREMLEQEFDAQADWIDIALPTWTCSPEKATIHDAARGVFFDEEACSDRLCLSLEPHAAIRATTLPERAGPRRVLVFDVGGRGFDAAVVEESAGAPPQIRRFGGDRFLGGAQFSARLAAWIGEKAGVADLSGHEPWLNDLAESVKKSLSSDHLVEIAFASPAGSGPASPSSGLAIDRGEFEELIADLVGRAVGEALRIVTDAELTPTAIADIVLSGGSSNIPMIAAELSRAFERPAIVSDPEWIVARGAALLALDTTGPWAAPPTHPPDTIDASRHFNTLGSWSSGDALLKNFMKREERQAFLIASGRSLFTDNSGGAPSPASITLLTPRRSSGRLSH